MTQRGIWVRMSIEAERRSSEPRTIFSQVSEAPANHSPSRKLASLLIGGRDFETSSNSSVLCWYCWRQLLTLTEKVFHFQNKERYVDISLQDLMFICERSSIWPLGVVKHLGPQWPERERRDPFPLFLQRLLIAESKERGVFGDSRRRTCGCYWSITLPWKSGLASWHSLDNILVKM